MKQRIALALLTCILFLGTSEIALAGKVKKPKAQKQSGPVVAHLLLRDHTVTVNSTPKGYRYSVSNIHGKVYHANLSESKLQKKYPVIFNLIQPTIIKERPNKNK